MKIKKYFVLATTMLALAGCANKEKIIEQLSLDGKTNTEYMTKAENIARLKSDATDIKLGQVELALLLEIRDQNKRIIELLEKEQNIKKDTIPQNTREIVHNK